MVADVHVPGGPHFQDRERLFAPHGRPLGAKLGSVGLLRGAMFGVPWSVRVGRGFQPSPLAPFCFQVCLRIAGPAD
eukprot:4332154-Pyramimonas_sp.AAC.1